MRWCAIGPACGPPNAWRSAALSITQLIAFRTCTSSNGGFVRFIET